MVKGWDEAVKQLSVGEKASCVFPSSARVLVQGVSKLDSTGADLHVTMELVSIMKGD